MDNVFVMVMIFSFFGIFCCYQYQVLFWGIFGVIVLWVIMIGLGVVLVKEFDWIMYVFGVFLLFSGVKMLFNKYEEEFDFEYNLVLCFLCKYMWVIKELYEYYFFVCLLDVSGKLVCYVILLFFVLVLIELVDLVFVVDSVLVIFVIIQDLFIVYILNIFVIFGLCVLYFLLVVMIYCFVYLKYVLVLVLVFIGMKIMFYGVIGKIFVGFLFGVIFGLLVGGILFFLLKICMLKVIVEDKVELNVEYVLD